MDSMFTATTLLTLMVVTSRAQLPIPDPTPPPTTTTVEPTSAPQPKPKPPPPPRGNVALRRPAWQSSVYRGHKASLANDGRMSTFARYCMITKRQRNPWWAVDLGSRYRVDTIKFTNRRRYGYRAGSFIVGLTDVSPAKKAPRLRKYDICGQWPGRVRNGATVRMKCNANLPPRRYVVVQLARAEHLQICELQVFLKRTQRRAPTQTPAP